MIVVQGVQKATIRAHYQLGTLFYRLLWGPHIHHGLWNGDESPGEAQCQLTDTLAAMCEISSTDTIVDIGCGMGGSSIRLAQRRGCDVTGVTLSPLQRRWASLSARLHGVTTKTRFLAGDAESIEFADDAFDVMWSIECTEHLFDKPAFFRRSARWLRPGGRMAIGAWFEGEDTTQTSHRAQVEEVCRRFVCPSLATRKDYASWIEAAGLTIRENVDWTERTAKTWEICKQRVARTGVRHIAKFLDKDQVAFIDGFDTLLNAYRSGAMQYGAIIAVKND
ncbi:Demethylrebeccamycin-D-glucose O-methyltransferase [Novipirellula galeiformis]|uniref:Demethylrebeccamycin-D-glucose O-methyltransferase n=1 Tax=Novipirellula galeiformis TaxID=2528004 RepID=A0A5C6CHQ4_9BACT|nr:methyltransferase domain-containing protein [Novipirellula galeiformis]TWU24433.1 Demethylrebeccamycin-D-glucose O-methyltransferase [Novipirellula galeiformis]